VSWQKNCYFARWSSV